MRRLIILLLIAGFGCSDDTATAPDQSLTDQQVTDTASADSVAHDSATADQGTVVDLPVTDSPLTKPDQELPADLAPTADMLDCKAMVSAFQHALQAAKTCTPGLKQCVAKEIGLIYPGCACPTFVNSAMTTEIALMTALRKQFAAAKCLGPVCKCINPASAICQASDGGAGACVDQ